MGLEHRHTGQVFLGGQLTHLCPKTAMLSCKIALPD